MSMQQKRFECSLVECNEETNESFQTGLSCLHIAAAMGHADIVQLLCEHGADLEQKLPFEEQNATALYLAESQQHTSVCQVLRSFAARKASSATTK